MKTTMPCGEWLFLFFVPSLAAVFISVTGLGRSIPWQDKVWIWWFISAWCYVFVLSLIHSIASNRRGGDIVIASALTTLGAMLGNLIVSYTVFFAGCACASRKL